MNFGALLVFGYFLVYFVGMLFGLSKIFKRAGIEPWKAWVPFLNIFEWIKLVGRPLWWFPISFIPIANLFVLVYLLSDLGKCYGKIRFRQQAAILLIPFYYIPKMASEPDLEYKGTVLQVGKLKKSQVREWADAIAFAVFAATLIRWSTFEAFTIPTPSMENSLLVGDYLFVSKLHYGPRTPKTPLQVPLTHQKIWFTENFVDGGLDSYLTWIDLPTFRLPGFSHVKRNDVVVFNFPDEFGHPVDLKTNYIKRCVAVAGDSIRISNDSVFINSEFSKFPEQVEFKYYVEAKAPIRPDRFRKLGINTDYIIDYYNGYLIDATFEQIKAIKGFTDITRVVNTNDARLGLTRPVYPNNPEHRLWTPNNFGTLWIPEKGAKIPLTRENVILYSKQIEYFEGHEDVVITDDYKVKMKGKIISEYTFKQDYYFMMGDNRGNSEDSRYWGFVPANHVVGKAALIWMSKDPHGGVRYDRLFNIID